MRSDFAVLQEAQNINTRWFSRLSTRSLFNHCNWRTSDKELPDDTLADAPTKPRLQLAQLGAECSAVYWGGGVYDVEG
jgi:hypothetical protein